MIKITIILYSLLILGCTTLNKNHKFQPSYRPQEEKISEERRTPSFQPIIKEGDKKQDDKKEKEGKAQSKEKDSKKDGQKIKKDEREEKAKPKTIITSETITVTSIINLDGSRKLTQTSKVAEDKHKPTEEKKGENLTNKKTISPPGKSN